MFSRMNFGLFCDDPADANGYRVAIAGAGPAGLAAAGFLACRGYHVEVFDKMPKPGGLLLFGIPDFRLPIPRIAEAMDRLAEDYGVVFHLRTKVVGSLEDPAGAAHDEGDVFVTASRSLADLRRDFHAVMLCTGSWRSRRLNVPGENLPQVMSGLEFLFPLRGAACAPGEVCAPEVAGRKVVVIGAGLSAVDAVHSAQRAGAAEVHLFYRRTIAEAPAGAHEVRSLVDRGCHWRELAMPTAVRGEDKVEGVEFVQCSLGEPDESGRRCPIPDKDNKQSVEADMVICAVGELPTLPDAAALDMKRTRKGGSAWPRMTMLDGVFVAGDCLTGPSKIGWALTGGLEAARSMERWLRYVLRHP
jgi:glutamate synthase (NADPH/NADH) small chain